MGCVLIQIGEGGGPETIGASTLSFVKSRLFGCSVDASASSPALPASPSEVL
jgi:hypothetical protein